MALGTTKRYTAAAAMLVAGIIPQQAHADRSHFTSEDAYAYNAGDYGDAPNQTYYSSEVVSPRFLINTFNQSAAVAAAESSDEARFLFTDPDQNGNAGPMFFDAKDLSLVYANQTYEHTWDTRVQSVNGTRYLTFWEGSSATGHGHGDLLFFDETYTLKYNVTAKDLDSGTRADFHELQVTDNATVLFTIYEAVEGVDLSSVDGPEDGTLMDNLIQEVDLETGDLVWSWRASDHFNLTDTFMDYDTRSVNSNGFDFFHLNSIQKFDDGNYLVSSRHLRAVMYISGETGEPIWILGGRLNDFEDLDTSDNDEDDEVRGATDIGFQHDARFQDTTTRSRLTLFDNASIRTDVNCTANCSRGLDIQLDTDAMTARIVHEYYHPASLHAGAQGGLHRLNESGNAVIAWGSIPAITEHSLNDEVLLDIQTGRFDGDRTGPGMYRAYKLNWVGRPTWDPSIAVASASSDNDDDSSSSSSSSSSSNGTRIYVSWNGATEVDTWALLAGNDSSGNFDGEHMLGRVNRTGFETGVQMEGDSLPQYARFVALSSEDEILGSTAVVSLTSGDRSEADAISSIAGGRNESLADSSGFNNTDSSGSPDRNRDDDSDDDSDGNGGGTSDDDDDNDSAAPRLQGDYAWVILGVFLVVTGGMA